MLRRETTVNNPRSAGTGHASPHHVRGAAGEAVWSLALELLASVQPGRLLDAAAGGGDLAAKLVAGGFEVTGADIVDQWQYPTIPFVCADLDLPLPFEADAFDVAILVEAMGYLENPCHLFREFARVVRPGGAVVMTVPNALSLQSRLRFMLNGTYRWFPHPVYRGGDKQGMADTYRDPIRPATLLFLLEQSGFTPERVVYGGLVAHAPLIPLGWTLRTLVTLHNALQKDKAKTTPAYVNSTSALLRTNVGVLARNRA